MGIQRILFTVGIVLACAVATRAEDARSPVPDAEAQQKALALVREVYEAEYSKAETPAQKEDLAGKLLERAGEATDPVNKYALLRAAGELSIQGGGPTAFAAVDETARSFQIDGLEMSTEVLGKYGTMAKTPAQNKAVAEKAAELINRALAADKLSLATESAKVGLAAARKSRDGPLVKQVGALGEEVEEAAAAYAAMKAALVVLEAKPADPEANLAVGEYYCLMKGDWGKGLPMLALGSDPALKELAVKELKGPSDVTGQLALADGWWDLAQTAKGAAGRQLLARAGHWYTQASPKLTGLLKDRAEKRLSQIGPVESSPAKRTSVDLARGAALLMTFEPDTFLQHEGKTRVRDFSRQGCHGIVEGATPSKDGRAGAALQLDGRDDSILVPALRDHLIRDVNGLTICAWVRPDGNDNGHPRFVLDIGGFAEGGTSLSLRPGKSIRFVVPHGSGGVDLQVEEALAGQWRHVAARWDGAEQRIYVDGVLKGSMKTSRKALLTDQGFADAPARIGSLTKRDARKKYRYFPGMIDEVAVFTRALAEHEIQALYEMGQRGQTLR